MPPKLPATLLALSPEVVEATSAMFA